MFFFYNFYLLCLFFNWFRLVFIVFLINFFDEVIIVLKLIELLFFNGCNI